TAEEGLRRVDRALRKTAHAAGDGRACGAVNLHHHRVVAANTCGPAIGDDTDRASSELEQCVRGILDIDGVELSTLVYALLYGSRHQCAHRGHGCSQPVDHVTPV